MASTPSVYHLEPADRVLKSAAAAPAREETRAMCTEYFKHESWTAAVHPLL
jgi:hypothetical protein